MFSHIKHTCAITSMMNIYFLIALWNGVSQSDRYVGKAAKDKWVTGRLWKEARYVKLHGTCCTAKHLFPEKMLLVWKQYDKSSRDRNRWHTTHTEWNSGQSPHSTLHNNIELIVFGLCDKVFLEKFSPIILPKHWQWRPITHLFWFFKEIQHFECWREAVGWVQPPNASSIRAPVLISVLPSPWATAYRCRQPNFLLPGIHRPKSGPTIASGWKLRGI